MSETRKGDIGEGVGGERKVAGGGGAGRRGGLEGERVGEERRSGMGEEGGEWRGRRVITEKY